MFFCFWVKKQPIHLVLKQLGGGGWGVGESSKMFIGAYRGTESSGVRVCFVCLRVSLTFIQKGCTFQKWISFCCHDISFLYFKLFFQTKVSQKAFNFNQIEPYVYSIL